MKDWQGVLTATKRRRSLGVDDGENYLGSQEYLSRFVTALSKEKGMQDIANAMVSDKKMSQATLALGITYYNDFNYCVLCRKGASSDSVDNIRNALANVGGPLTVLEDISNNESGLHAEMAILRYMVGQKVLNRYSLPGTVAVVCIGKAVCMDCAGYMNSKQIGHCSFVGDGRVANLEFSCGKVSTMGGGQWTHPFTSASYIGGNNINTYQKGGRSINSMGV